MKATTGVHSPLAAAIAAAPVRMAPGAPTPVTRVPAARDQRDDKHTRAKAPSRAPEPKTAPAAALAGATAAPSAPSPLPAAPVLPRYHGSLVIHSEPLGALVSVDGQVVGATPLRLKGIRAGSRVVRIEFEGYDRWSAGARVVANRETALIATLQRASGH